jgi:hypothetical protein
MGAPSAEVEVLEEAEGWGVSEGALVVTFVLLLIALGFVDYAMGSLYGAGMLF